MNFQTKHIETYSYQKRKMTTALAIKCIDGILLTTDSQGTQYNSIKKIEKVFEINKSVGLVGAGKDDQVKDLVRHFKDIPEDFKTEKELTNYLNQHLFELHKEKNTLEYAKINLD